MQTIIINNVTYTIAVNKEFNTREIEINGHIFAVDATKDVQADIVELLKAIRTCVAQATAIAQAMAETQNAPINTSKVDTTTAMSKEELLIAEEHMKMHKWVETELNYGIDYSNKEYEDAIAQEAPKAPIAQTATVQTTPKAPKAAMQVIVAHVGSKSIPGFTDVYIGRAKVAGKPFKTPANWVGSGEFGNMTFKIEGYQPPAEQIAALRNIGDKLLLRCFCHKTPVTDFSGTPICHGEVMAKHLLAHS